MDNRPEPVDKSAVEPTLQMIPVGTRFCCIVDRRAVKNAGPRRDLPEVTHGGQR
jgi:hypothetical protein